MRHRGGRGGPTPAATPTPTPTALWGIPPDRRGLSSRMRLTALAAVLASALAAAPAPAQPAPAWPPPSPGDLLARARALRAEGDAAGARARLEAALWIAPAYDDARHELADVLLSDGIELDRAAELLAGVRRTRPRTHLLAARLAELRADDAGAVAAYARALEAGDDPDARIRRALALGRLGRTAEAIDELKRVRAARPDDPIARGGLAMLYEGAGRYRDAEREYRAIAEAHPARAQGWEDLARFCERTGRYAEARAAHRRARQARGGERPRELRPLPPSKR